MGLRQRASEPSDTISSGVVGFDDITGGGLPRGRVTVVLGGAGCGKTIFALQALVTGARNGEPGLFVTFEENPDQIVKDTRHFDWKLSDLRGNGIELFDAQLSNAIVQGGEFDLVGLLAIIGARATQTKAKRIVFDGLDVLLGHLGTPTLIRREIFRLREWLYSAGMTGIITAKADAADGRPTADYDFLEFIADCVVTLQHRVSAGAAVRMFRVKKYRGIGHSANEFPFTITRAGIDVASSTSAEINHPVFKDRLTSGVAALDVMLRGGFYRGSGVLISGAPGTSKTSLTAAFADAACLRKEPTVYISFDEAPTQIVRNVVSIGIDLGRHVQSGVLRMCSLRARSDNPQAHVARIRALVDLHGAQNLIVDPISAFSRVSDEAMGDRAAIQIFDMAKSRGVTTVNTSLLASGSALAEETPIGISTIADTWMHVSYVNKGGERNRALTIIKSRGMSHSNQVRELILTDSGITLADPYMAGGEVLMGTLRWERENEDRRAKVAALAELHMHEKHAELALAETHVRVEAARVEQAVREADLERIVAARLATTEIDRTEKVELRSRRGGTTQTKRPLPGRR